MAQPLRASAYRIDPFDLRLFMAVVGQGSITAGARSVSLSLAAASARLTQLEHGMGTPLLQRAKRGVTPTGAGQTLLRGAGRLLRELDALHDEMAPHARGLRGTIRLWCNTAAASEYLPPLIGRFLAANPRLDIDLQEAGSQEVLQALHLSRADIGIVADHVDPSGLVAQPFRTDELVVLAGPGGRFGRRRTVAFADVTDHPVVGLSDGAGLTRFLRQQALLAGRSLRYRVQVKSFEAVADLVAQGVGVAVLPRHAAQRCPRPGVRALPLIDAWASRQLRVCHLATPQPTSGAARLLAALLEPAPGESRATGPAHSPPSRLPA